jgi:hypothetical protein
MTTILVTTANGDTGRPMVDYLLKEGSKVGRTPVSSAHILDLLGDGLVSSPACQGELSPLVHSKSA